MKSQEVPDSRFRCNTFGINPHDDLIPFRQDSQEILKTHHNYLVYNIGRTEVYVELKYGTKVMWEGIADAVTVRPGETKMLNTGDQMYHVTAVRICNNTDIRAIVHCKTEDNSFRLSDDKECGAFDIVRDKLLLNVFKMGVKYIPDLDAGFPVLLSTFWTKESSIWKEMLTKLEVLVDNSVIQKIETVLAGILNYCNNRITILTGEIERNECKKFLRNTYMSNARDLVNLEKQFTFGQEMYDYKNVNQYILPLYSSIVLLKISFYVMGIRQQELLGLTDEDVLTLGSLADKTIYGEDGANKYITSMYEERVDHAYRTAYAEDLFDVMMNTRTCIATQGLEYIPMWNHMVENPIADAEVYNDVISYSTFWGRQTPSLIAEAIPEEMRQQPLTPKLVDGKRNKIDYIVVHMWHKKKSNDGLPRPPKIGGMKVVFQNGDSYMMGTVNTRETHKIEFKGSLLDQLIVEGNGALNYLEFHFIDKRTIVVGTRDKTCHEAFFELDDHHICSLFLASDIYGLEGQAANISVAYQLIEKSARSEDMQSSTSKPSTSNP